MKICKNLDELQIGSLYTGDVIITSSYKMVGGSLGYNLINALYLGREDKFIFIEHKFFYDNKIKTISLLPDLICKINLRALEVEE